MKIIHKPFIDGLLTGLLLQIAIGPVFFFIFNLVLQKSILDGLVGVLAVTIADYLYIFFAIFGVGKLLENKNIKKILGFVSSIMLFLFGIYILFSIFQSKVCL
jgi:arginine exporter protein ArgO